MKQNTQELQNFSIYENGELVQEPLTIQAVRVAGNIAVEALSAISKPVGRVLGEMGISLALDMFDMSQGTNLRHQYYEKKRRDNIAAMAGKFELDG